LALAKLPAQALPPPTTTTTTLPPVTTTTTTTLPPVTTTTVQTVPNDLVGKRLDVAEVELSNMGISYKEVGGGTFGIVVRSNWVVCSTMPAGGQPVSGAVDLIVNHFNC
jgi:hypothetical protein